MLAHGTTTAEAKSGYGLTEKDEIRALVLLKDLQADPSLPRLVPTLMAAHEIPPEFRDDRAEWVRIVADEIVPRVARENLARYCDVFCEQGVFTVPESRRILEAARRAGLGLRVHADELALSGGAMLAAELKADSADHLLFIGAAEIAAMAASGTVAVVLPGNRLVDALAARAGPGAHRGRRPGGHRLGLEPRHLLHRVARGGRRPCLPRLGPLGRGNADRDDPERRGIARPGGRDGVARARKVRRSRDSRRPRRPPPHLSLGRQPRGRP